MRSFNADDTPATRPLRLSRTAAVSQIPSDLAVGPNGEAVAIWAEPEPSADPSQQVFHIMARVLRPPE